MSGGSRGGLIGRLADEFELAWRRRPPEFDEYYTELLRGEARVLDSAGRLALLEEMIKLDLEFRWRAVSSPPQTGVARSPRRVVQDYVTRHPELMSPAGNLPALLAEEFRVRCRWGDRPSRQSYARDYPHLEPELSSLLGKVEAELGDQAGLPPPPSVKTGSHVSRPSHSVPQAAPSRRPTPTFEATERQPLSPDLRPPAAVRPDPKDSSGRKDVRLPTVPGYEILRVLGQGGMGVVYQARDERLNRLVALKMILSGACARPDDMKRFHQEAQAVARLKHPNIVQVFNLGECDGRPYIAIEYVAGGSLSSVLSGTPQPVRRAAAFAAVMARAMHYAHECGIVHRDLKPANILLESAAPAVDGRGDARPGPDQGLTSHAVPKVADFGLAKLLGDPAGDTQTGQVMGTPSYMSPEQAAGRVREIGPATDIYALGAVLYELLTGRPPFKGATTIETLDQVRTQDPVPPRMLQPSVPRDVETVCLKCLAKEPAWRYRSAAELADDLDRFGAGQPVLARPVGAATRAWKFFRRNPRVVYAGASVLVLLVMVTIASVIAAIQFRARAETERKRLGEELAKAIRVAEGELSQGHDVALAEELLNRCPETYRGWEWRHLMRRCYGNVPPLQGHEAGLWCVAHSPDGREVATASIDGRVRLWDVETGRCTFTFEGHLKPLKDIDLTKAPDLKAGLQAANELAIGMASNGLAAPARLADVSKEVTRILDPVKQLPGGLDPTKLIPPGFDPSKVVPPALDPIKTVLPALGLPTHLSPVMCVAYSPDGRMLASGGLDPNISDPRNSAGTVILWRRDGHIEKKIPDAHRLLVTALAFSPDGTRLATAGLDKDHTWKLWDVASGKMLKAVAGHTGTVSQVRFSPDGKLLASASADGTARIWDMATFQVVRTFPDHRAPIHDLAFRADGRRLVTAGMDGTVRVFDLEGGAAPVVMRGHIGSALGVAYHPDGSRVASAGFDRTVRIWDPEAGEEKITLRGHKDVVWCVAFSADGQRLASAGFDQTARIWDSALPAAATAPGIFDIRGHEDRVNRLAFTPDGRRLVTASWDQTVKVWDGSTGTLVHNLRGHESAVWGVACSPDNRQIASASWDKTVRIWDADTGREERCLRGPEMAVHCVAFSPDGHRVAAGCWDGTVSVWDVRTGEKLAGPEGHLLPVMSLAFSPDGRYLATASGDRSVRLWDTRTWNLAILPPQEHGATVYAVAFDPNGRRFAAASWDGTVSVWRSMPGGVWLKEKKLTGHQDYIYGVAFSPDGKRLATVSNDKTLRVWDSDTGEQMSSRSLRGVAWSVAYHPDGTRIAAAVWNRNCWVQVVAATP